MIRRAARTGRRGVTLVELVVAMAIATVGLLGLLATLHSSARLDRHSRERSVALLRAQSVLEDLLGRPWADLAAQDGQLFDVPMELGAGRVVNLRPAPGLARAGSITVVPWGGGLRRVTVLVRWRAAPGATGGAELRLETLVGERS